MNVSIWRASVLSVCATFAGMSSSGIAQQWTPPQPGWIYVLDAGRGSGNGRVFLVDPIAGKVKGFIPSGITQTSAFAATDRGFTR